MSKIRKQQGFIKWVVLIVIALLVLSYFGFDVRNLIESEQFQKNFNYVWGGVVAFWTNYLARPVLYLWNDIFVDILWASFVDNLQRLRGGGQSDLELNTPTVQ